MQSHFGILWARNSSHLANGRRRSFTVRSRRQAHALWRRVFFIAYTKVSPFTCVLYRTTAKFESMHLNWPALRKTLNPQLCMLASILNVHLGAALTNWPVSSIEPLRTPWMATSNGTTEVVLLGAREWHNTDRASTRHNVLHRHSDESAFLQNSFKRIWFEQLPFACEISCTCSFG